jgi:hypothetical protein
MLYRLSEYSHNTQRVYADRPAYFSDFATKPKNILDPKSSDRIE